MTPSTLAFLFTPDFQKVLLIKKIKPVHHKGLYNGLGGKVEKGESSLQCVVREVTEESGLHTNESDWVNVGKLLCDGWQMQIFTSVYKSTQMKIMNQGDEEVAWVDVNNLPRNVVSNLRWLIPMCVDRLNGGEEFTVDIKYVMEKS